MHVTWALSTCLQHSLSLLYLINILNSQFSSASVPWSVTKGRRQNLTIDMAQNLLLNGGIADNFRNSSIETPTNNEILHKCDQCNYSSFYKGNLYRHMRQMKHNPEKILNCEKCKFTSFDVVELKEHTRKHQEKTGKTKCDQCNFSSIYPTSLRTHIRRHNPEKIFKCDQCSFTKEISAPY